jgi:outer membrane protein assembly factor BamE (lipoprotein component of BamABCDE complex)
MRYLAAVLIVGTLSSCEFQRAQVASDAKLQMVGLSQEDVLSCMGAPVRKEKVGQTEVWAYGSGNNRRDTVGGGDVDSQGGFFAGFTSIGRSCTVNIVMQSERVSSVNYTGATGGLLTKGEQCGFAVENCVKKK